MKISRKIVLCLTPLLFIASFNVATAGTVTIIKDMGTLENTTALTGYATTGAMMDGMSVGITYGSGATTSAIWGDTGISSGQANWGDGFLSLVGDSFDNAWNLVAQTGVSSILMDAGVGDSVFDTTFGGAFGTDGSARGTTFSILSGGDDYDVTATYINAVGIGGNAAVGDIFRYLNVDFGGKAFLGSLSFLQDTDNIAYTGDINPVPVPAAAWLFGSAVLGLVGFSRRKTKLR